MQTDQDFEVIVADNGASAENHRMVIDMQDERFRYIDTAQHATTPGWDCYWSAEWIVEHEAKGEWFCFPSDDSYYMPLFQQACITQAKQNDWQLVFPEMIYDRRRGGKYSVLGTHICVGSIDKCGFLIRRDVWMGFPGKPQVPSASSCDGEMIEQLVRNGVRWGKVDEILCVHN